MKNFLLLLIIVFSFVLAKVDSTIAQTRSPWQRHYGAPLQPLGFKSDSYGDSTEYLFESIPTANDTGWGPAPNPDVIKFNEASAECFIVDPIYNCRRVVDYTYFQTFVSYPSNMQLTKFTIRLYGLDDGCRLTVFNSTYPNGYAIPGTFVKLGDGGNKFSLLAYANPCELNRFVITHVDDCCGGVVLDTAFIDIAGQIIPSNLLTMSSTPVLCSDKDSSGTATAVSSAIGPFTYLWNTVPPQTTSTAIGLPVGTYSCTVTPAVGCATIGTVQVSATPPVSVNIVSPTALLLNTCAYGKTAHVILGYPGVPQKLSLSAIPSGGTPPYSYSWSGNGSQYLTSKTSLTPQFNPAAQVPECSTYTLYLQVKDSKGCIGKDTVEIKVVRATGPKINQCSSNSAKKILICHVPPGNTSNPQTISISTNALSAHTFGPTVGPNPTSNAHKSDCIGTCSVACGSSLRLLSNIGESEFLDIPLEEEQLSLEIVPNPNRGNFQLNLHSIESSECKLILYNLVGGIVHMQTLKNLDHGLNSLNWEINAEKAPQGIYFISVELENGQKTVEKFSIIRD